MPSPHPLAHSLTLVPHGLEVNVISWFFTSRIDSWALSGCFNVFFCLVLTCHGINITDTHRQLRFQDEFFDLLQEMYRTMERRNANVINEVMVHAVPEVAEITIVYHSDDTATVDATWQHFHLQVKVLLESLLPTQVLQVATHRIKATDSVQEMFDIDPWFVDSPRDNPIPDQLQLYMDQAIDLLQQQMEPNPGLALMQSLMEGRGFQALEQSGLINQMSRTVPYLLLQQITIEEWQHNLSKKPIGQPVLGMNSDQETFTNSVFSGYVSATLPVWMQIADQDFQLVVKGVIRWNAGVHGAVSGRIKGGSLAILDAQEKVIWRFREAQSVRAKLHLVRIKNYIALQAFVFRSDGSYQDLGEPRILGSIPL